MAGQLKHASVGPELTQAEYESLTAHIIDGGAAGDTLYFDGTNITRIPIGAAGTILTVVAGVPTWSTPTASITGPLRLADGTEGAPAYSWADDTDTGIFKRSAGGSNQVTISAGGFARAEFGSGTLQFLSTYALGWSDGLVGSVFDITLYRDAAAVFAQRNGGVAQTFRVYGTYTDASNYERAALFTTAGSGITLAAQTAGTGGDNLSITLTPAGTGNVIVTSGQILAPDGTKAAPSISFASAPTQGAYWRAGILMGWTTGGTEKAQLDGNGNLYLAGGTLGLGGSSDLSVATNDVFLTRDSANNLAQRNSTNAQIFRVYNTYTDGSNNEQLFIGWSANEAYLVTNESGTGSPRSLTIGTQVPISTYLMTNNTRRWEVTSAGHLIAFADNTYDIGASGATRPRNIYTGTQFLAANGSVGTPSYSFASDTDSGMYSATGNVVDLVSAGIGQFRIQNTLVVLPAVNALTWASGVLGNPADLLLYRDAANTLAQRNSTTAQELRIYNTYTDASNYERGVMSWSVVAANRLFVGTVSAGTGSLRPLDLGGNSIRFLSIGDNSTAVWQFNSLGHFLAGTDNTYDIGAAGATRPRSIYVGTNITVGGQVLAADGTDPLPAVSATNDPNTGFRFGSDNIRMITNGTNRISLTTSAYVLRSDMSVVWTQGTTDVTQDLFLVRDAANTLAQRNGANAQLFNIYNTYTDGSNNERAFFGWSSNALVIGNTFAGTGVARAVNLWAGGAHVWTINTSGHLLAATDNTHDIGAAGATRPRNLYVAGTGTFGGAVTVAASGINVTGTSTFNSAVVSANGQGFFFNMSAGSQGYLTSNAATLVMRPGSSGLTIRNNADAANILVLTDAGNLGIGNAASTTTMLLIPASVAGVSSLRVPHGTAPAAPVDGDMWTTTAGLFVRINGVTVGPLS